MKINTELDIDFLINFGARRCALNIYEVIVDGKSVVYFFITQDF